MNNKLGIGALSLLTLSIIAAPTFAKGNEKTNGGTTPQGKPFVYVGDQIEVIEAVQLSLQEQIDDLVGKVSSIEEHVEATKDAIALLKARDTALQALIDSNEGNITDLQGEITRLEGELTQLRTDMASGDDTLLAKINEYVAIIGVLQLAVSEEGDLQIQIDALKAENISLRLAMEDGDSSLQDQIDANLVLIGGLQDQIDVLGTLQDQIDANADLIAGLQSQIDALQAEIALQNSYMNRECPAGSFLHSTSDDGTYACEVDSGTDGVGGFRQLRVYSSNTVPAFGGTRTASATCPTGSILTGGGGFFPGSGFHGAWPQLYYVSDVTYVIGNRTWSASANNSNSSYSRDVYAMAVCLEPL